MVITYALDSDDEIEVEMDDNNGWLSRADVLRMARLYDFTPEELANEE